MHQGLRRSEAFAGLVGTGGIGGGDFFALSGNHTLGREESRGGRYLDRQDYCKLHIIAHYLRRLMPAEFQVLPVGSLGDDAPGRRLLGEIKAAGLDTRLIRELPGRRTLYSLCFLYPDGSGGNLTVEDSASGYVTPGDIRRAEPVLAELGARGMVLAAPEVPLAARGALLELGGRHGCLRAASFTSSEMPAVQAAGLLEQVDVLALNLDEAAALAGVDSGLPPEQILQALSRMWDASRLPLLSITAGSGGSRVYYEQQEHFLPVLPVSVACTSGAGDAHFAGLLAGLAAGLPPSEAHELARLTAAVSVTSPHTINFDLHPRSLLAQAQSCGLELSAILSSVLSRR